MWSRHDDNTQSRSDIWVCFVGRLETHTHTQENATHSTMHADEYRDDDTHGWRLESVDHLLDIPTANSDI